MTMKHMTFGRLTGLRVSEYALGAGNFGTRWGTGAEPDEARRMFDRFAEAGGTLIDTAETYQQGQSEEILSDLLAADRDHFVLASKYAGASRKDMYRAVEGSLRRLNTDRLDLYWVHFDDRLTPVEELVRGLDDLVSAGKILHAGFSNFPAWRVSRAQTIAELRGWTPITGLQIEYSLVERTADRELLPMAEALGLGVALWSPLAGGLLTGKYRVSDEGRLTDWQRLVHTEDSAHKTAVVDELLAVAGELGAPPAQVAIAWLRHRRSTTPLIPIIGPRTIEQLDDYLAALELELPEEHVERLSNVSAVPLGVPHDVIARVASGRGDVVAAPAVPVA